MQGSDSTYFNFYPNWNRMEIKIRRKSPLKQQSVLKQFRTTNFSNSNDDYLLAASKVTRSVYIVNKLSLPFQITKN